MPREVVLVAEPDPLQRQLIDMLLAPDAMQLTMVDSGRQALEYLREQTPDVALLALDLPDMPGDEICSKVKKVSRLKYVPVILVAPQGDGIGLAEEHRWRGEGSGADLVVPRPLGDKNLRERIRRLAQSGAEQREQREAAGRGDGTTTHVIEEALGALGAGKDDPAAGGRPAASGAGGDGAGAQQAAEDGAWRAREDAADGPGPSTEARSMREELNALKMENRQLHRKLQTKHEELSNVTSPKVQELQRQVNELERRNKALLETISELKRKGGGRRGLFGRGRS